MLLKYSWRPLARPEVFSRRFLNCLGCGTHFQHKFPGTPGYPAQAGSQPKPSIVGLQHQQYEKLLEKLSPEQRKALNLDGVETKGIDAQVRRDAARQKREKRNKEYCSWCQDSMQHRTSPIEPAIKSRNEVFDEIPQGSRVVHVIDILDFPLGFDPEIPSLFGDKAHYVISRSDLTLMYQSQISRMHHYVMEEVFTKLGVPSNHVHVVSAKRGWGVKKLAEILREDTYFVGKTNAGKTSLIHSLAGRDYNSSTWPVPFKTQEFTMFRSSPGNGSKSMWDTPSFPENTNNGRGIFEYLSPKYLRKISEGGKMFKEGSRYSSMPQSAHPNQKIGIAGLVCLEYPDTGADRKRKSIHSWPIFGGYVASMSRITASIDKMKENNISEKHAGWTVLRQETGQDIVPVAKFLASHAANSPTIVIRGVGAIQTKLFSTFPEGYEITVNALEGLEIGFRSEIAKWIEHKADQRYIKDTDVDFAWKITKLDNE